MKNFAYTLASQLDEAADALGNGVTLVAGGTELLNWFRLGISSSAHVLDITRIESLKGISVTDQSIRIGSLATLGEIEAHPGIRERAPVLSRACLKAASAQLRNRATIGGNVLQKTRCPYFRAAAGNEASMPWPCNKRVPGSGCSALEGHYDRAALFGATEACVANQPSDPAVALASLDAEVEVARATRSRRIKMTDFHLTQRDARDVAGTREARAIFGSRLPDTAGAEALLENRLRHDELIVAYHVPIDAASRRSAYLKVRERESYEYAIVSAACCLTVDDDRVVEVRLALGSVAQKPWRLREAEAALPGVALTKDALVPVVELAMADARPVAHQAHKVTLARNAAVRAVLVAGGKING